MINVYTIYTCTKFHVYISRTRKACSRRLELYNLRMLGYMYFQTTARGLLQEVYLMIILGLFSSSFYKKYFRSTRYKYPQHMFQQRNKKTYIREVNVSSNTPT